MTSIILNPASLPIVSHVQGFYGVFGRAALESI